MINDRFKNLIPPLSADEYDALETSLLAHGCRDALVMWNNVIVDGHNRYAICCKHGIKFNTVDMEFDSENDACIWIISNQFGRRNINSYTRSLLALQMKELIAAKAESRKHEGTNQYSLYQKSDKPSEPIHTLPTLAKLAGVSHDTIHKVYTIERKAPDAIKDKARSGEISINQAYNEVKKVERRADIERHREELAIIGQTKESDVDFRFGDFYDVLSDIADGSLDCIITDPPYPKEYLDQWSKLSAFAAKKLKPGGFCIAYSGQMHLPDVINRMCEHLDYYWTFAVYHEGSTQIVNGVNLMCRWKPVLIFQNGKQKLKNTFQDYFISDSREKEGHDWQQSISGVSYLIEMFTNVNEIICDPFAGSGTTIKAAIAKGRKVVAAEIDERSFLIAKASL